MDLRAKQKHFILHEPLKTVMWQLSWPAVLAMVLYGLNNFLDAVFVGQLMNEQALAGVGIAYPLSQLAVGFGSLVGTGAGTAISIWIGDNSKEKLLQALGTTNALSLIISVLFMIPAYIFAEPLIRMMGGTGEILTYGRSYFQATVFGTFFWIHGVALNMIIRGEGKMKTAAWMMGVGLVIDVALKPVFIKTFGWGVSGAAWATNIGMLLYSLVGLWYFAMKKASFQTYWNSLHINKEVLKQILSLGTPAMIMSVMGFVQNIAVFNAVAHHGSGNDIAFFASANRIILFMMTPLFGLMRALQPVIGMNFGAKKYERVKTAFKLFTRAGFFIVLPFWLLMTLFPHHTLNLLMPHQQWLPIHIQNFRVYIFILPFLPVIFMAMVFFPSIDQPKPASIMALLRQLILYIPVMLMIPKYFGTSGVFWGSTLIDIVIVSAIYWLIRKEFKKLDSLSIYPNRA